MGPLHRVGTGGHLEPCVFSLLGMKGRKVELRAPRLITTARIRTTVRFGAGKKRPNIVAFFNDRSVPRDTSVRSEKKADRMKALGEAIRKTGAGRRHSSTCAYNCVMCSLLLFLHTHTVSHAGIFIQTVHLPGYILGVLSTLYFHPGIYSNAFSILYFYAGWVRQYPAKIPRYVRVWVVNPT